MLEKKTKELRKLEQQRLKLTATERKKTMSRRFLLGELFEVLGLEKEDPKTLLGWMSNTKNLLESQKQEHAKTGEKLWQDIQNTETIQNQNDSKKIAT